MTKQVLPSFKKALFFATAISVSVLAPIYSVHASNNSQTIQVENSKSYIGVAIDKVPQALQLQLGKILPNGQGILVREVVPGSPAEAAQLQAYDIILSYNQEKLLSPKQLTELVRDGKKGDHVNMEIIRNGQVQSLQVVIGEQKVASNPAIHKPMHHRYSQHHPMHRYGMPFDSMQMPWSGNQLSKNWDSFQSMSLEKIKDNQYRAAIEYLDKDGVEQRYQFQGSRADIQQQLQQQEQLPEREKQQLMNLLSANQNNGIPDIGRLMSKEFFSQTPFDWNSMF